VFLTTAPCRSNETVIIPTSNLPFKNKVKWVSTWLLPTVLWKFVQLVNYIVLQIIKLFL